MMRYIRRAFPQFLWLSYQTPWWFSRRSSHVARRATYYLPLRLVQQTDSMSATGGVAIEDGRKRKSGLTKRVLQKMSNNLAGSSSSPTSSGLNASNTATVFWDQNRNFHQGTKDADAFSKGSCESMKTRSDGDGQEESESKAAISLLDPMSKTVLVASADCAYDSRNDNIVEPGASKDCDFCQEDDTIDSEIIDVGYHAFGQPSVVRLTAGGCAGSKGRKMSDDALKPSNLLRRQSVSTGNLFRQDSDSNANEPPDEPVMARFIPPVIPEDSSVPTSPLSASKAVSTQSLALRAISTKTVRNRSKGGNIIGSRGGSNWLSILSAAELDRHFPDRKITVFVGTWNMAGQKIPDTSLEEWLLPEDMSHLADVYAVGIQEGPTAINDWNLWEVHIQRIIGPSHVLYHSIWLGVQHLCIFVRREIVWFLSKPDHAVISTRLMTRVKTKGAVAVMFYCFGSSFLFISSHLTASMGRVRLSDRILDVQRIVTGLRFPIMGTEKTVDCTSLFDAVFWFGDLNFRLVDIPRPAVLEHVEKIYAAQKVGNAAQVADLCKELLMKDELQRVMQSGIVFSGFSEHPIAFPPTYKFDIGTVTTFDTSSKGRTPAYTDRVLTKCKQASNLECVLYRDAPQICNSDHKPVLSVFRVKLKPGTDKSVLSGGQFNRRVYARGLEATPGTGKRKTKSKFCSIQ